MNSLASMLSILRSGSQLDREDVERIKSAIESEESAMADLDSKILALEAQRDAIGKSLPIRRALIAPIRRLPPEVLADIFERCLPSDTSRSEYVTDWFENTTVLPPPIRPRADNDKDAPFLLLRVCHKWRDIAEQTARLWTNVSICCGNSIPFASFRLQNSRSAPLYVFISNTNGRYCCSSEIWRSRTALRGLHANGRSTDYVESIRPLASFAEIIKDDPEFYQALVSKLPLVKRLEYSGTFEVLSKLLAADMNSLREVKLTSSRNYEVPGENFPNLKATHLHTLALHEAAHMVTYVTPTKNLRRLVLTCLEEELPIGPISDFLRSCPGIEELVFHYQGPTTARRTNESEGPIHLHSLSNLQLGVKRVDSAEWIGLLHAPNLRAATISYQDRDMQPLQQLFSIARKSLKHLTFRRLGWFPLLHELFGALTEVETLGFINCTNYGSLWEYMTPGEGVPTECWICPKLQHLDIDSPFRLEDEAGFVEFIRRRSDDHAENIPPQHDGSCYLVDINFQGGLAISRSTATALSGLQVEMKGLTITGLPENLMDDRSSHYNEREIVGNDWQIWTLDPDRYDEDEDEDEDPYQDDGYWDHDEQGSYWGD